MVNLDMSEPLPGHLRKKILADSKKFFASREEAKEEIQKPFKFVPQRSIFGWLGWIIAATACVILAVNIWMTRFRESDIVENTKNIQTPASELSVSQKREQLLVSANKIQAIWTQPKPDKNLVTGDVVWDNTKQEGYVRFQGLPVNDAAKETYQLWIVDENQNPKTPVDGGVFNVNGKGEIILPINAKLKIGKPKMFAVTIEKPGGVVVSTQEKIVAIAKI